MKVAFVSLRPSAPIAKFDRKEVVASVTGEKEGTGSVQLPLASGLTAQLLLSSLEVSAFYFHFLASGFLLLPSKN